MIALLQRVTYAHVEVAGERVAQIGPGLLALIGIERADTSAHVARLLE
ncbi:MAG: D-aminoacyl-tRNA deacylase, partial [Gammaproteobacteria bacterium]|nr:D-aminoacyl-tRNA deacylase [Gammaproteobacteria bacterium]